MRNSSRTGSHRIRVRIKGTLRTSNIKGRIRIIPRMGNIKGKTRIMLQTDNTKTRLRTIYKIIYRITRTRIRRREMLMPLRFQVLSFSERKRPHGGFFSVRKKVNL